MLQESEMWFGESNVTICQAYSCRTLRNWDWKAVMTYNNRTSDGGNIGFWKTCHTGTCQCSIFVRPSIYKLVEEYCKACSRCTMNAPQPHFWSPLASLIIFEVPFERVAMGLVRPLPKSTRAHQHILISLDYATQIQINLWWKSCSTSCSIPTFLKTFWQTKEPLLRER